MFDCLRLILVISNFAVRSSKQTSSTGKVPGNVGEPDMNECLGKAINVCNMLLRKGVNVNSSAIKLGTLQKKERKLVAFIVR